jgi:hypothetical protein
MLLLLSYYQVVLEQVLEQVLAVPVQEEYQHLA